MRKLTKAILVSFLVFAGMIEAEETKTFSLDDIDFRNTDVSLLYRLSSTCSVTNCEGLSHLDVMSYRDFTNVVAVLRKLKGPRRIFMILSIDDVSDSMHPLETLATLTNEQFSIELCLHSCSNLTDVSMLGRMPIKSLVVSDAPLREIRGLEGCPIESLAIDDCPVPALEAICPMPGLRKMQLYGTGIKKQPSEEQIHARWGRMDLLKYRASNDKKGVIIPYFSETQRFAAEVADADRVVIRKGGYGCCMDPSKAAVLITLTNTQEIAMFRAVFKFKDVGENGGCMCCGFPGIDWWKGDKLLARTAIHHLKGMRWKGFYGDAEFSSESEALLRAWFSTRSIEIK